VQRGHQVEDVELVAQVQERRRLVQQEEFGVLGQRQGDPGAL